jgi:hypothetical protein
VVGSCEHGSEALGNIKCREFRDYQLLKSLLLSQVRLG